MEPPSIADAKALHDQKVARIDRLISVQKSRPHVEIASRIALAVLSSDLCIATYVHLSQSCARLLDHYNTQQNRDLSARQQSNDVLFAKLDQLRRDVENGKYRDNPSAAASQADLLLATGRVTLKTNALLDLARQLTTNSVIGTLNFAHVSLYALLRDDVASHNWAMLTTLGKVIVGLIPAFSSVLAIWELRQSLRDPQITVQSASSVLHSIDEYCLATHHWCVCTRLLWASFDSVRLGTRPTGLVTETDLDQASDWVAEQIRLRSDP